ncbi:uncharacterized protein PV07_10280 [Cladophialophora immunda]|uniref:Methyltransferase small domain-containing protein n=1 Tax=Cladophialophora immunda TaxID=569365 RepID=A0A0D2AI53_9EURO|nr:uncharacterized protein PV07_10280 [Cladophialophora immunda]KIW24572.1 hypothetical protein PV07_10280 [Cladophialophora immunda]OQV09944.1 Methyltransferase domain-containing protein [Cladophialophora immunda]
MLPTPSTSHVSYDVVYEPAEDSYLFLDTLSSASETAWLHARFSSSPVSVLSSSSEDTERQRQQTTRIGSESQSQSQSQSRPKTQAAPLVVEIGPGSGVVIAFLTAHAPTIFGRDVLSLSVDVNPYACRAARTTVEKALAETRAAAAATQKRKAETEEGERREVGHGQGQGHAATRARDGGSAYLSSLNGDLASPLRSGEVDVLVFNPPYVPTDSVPVAPAANINAPTTTAAPGPLTPVPPPPASSNTTVLPSFEEQSALLALSYAGGRDGMEVTTRLLRQIPDILSPRGVAYVLFCRGNRPDEVKSAIRAWPRPPGQEWEWRAETVGSSGKTAGWEKLEIVRIWRE